jgi:6-pyruvoyltetrahydropterin/6-carboxytetrahydropterin synthase
LNKNRISVFRKEHFNAAHRLYNPKWSDEKNELVFGLCNNPNFHGHNYELIVKITGEIDSETGYLFDMKVLSQIIKQNITDRFDHKNLNMDVPEFQYINPTAENIAIVIYDILKPQLPEQLDLSIRLYETERNFVQYPTN